MAQLNGRISQIIGPVIDVYFDTAGQNAEKVLPKIHDALKIARPDGSDLIIEVQQHIGEDTVRCVAMDNTDGLQRGLEVVQTGRPITMPAGEQIKGRMMNVIGKPIDGIKSWIWKAHILFTARHRNLKTFLHTKRCWLPVLRLSTCSNLI